MSIVGRSSNDFCSIPLLLQKDDIKSSLLKLRKLKKDQKVSFNVFCKVVAGAILYSMKNRG